MKCGWLSLKHSGYVMHESSIVVRFNSAEPHA
jgi:hypothetical protein